MPWTLALVLVALVLFKLKAHHAGKRRLQNASGHRIKYVGRDSRIIKFVASAALSAEGRRVSGDQPFLIRNGRQRELVLTRPDHIHDFYKDDTKDHTKPRNLNMGAYFGRILGDAVGVQAGERWKIIRAHFDPEFSFKASRRAIPSFEGAISHWLASLEPDSGIELDHEASFVIDAKKPCKFLTFKLLSMILYGEAFSERTYSQLLDLNAVHELVLHDVILNTRLTKTIWNCLNRAAAGRASNFNWRWEKMNTNLIRHARENGLNCPVERVFAGVDRARQMTKSEFLHTLDEILFANVDVSSAVLATMFKQLAAHEDYQQALRCEIRERKTQLDYESASYIAEQNSKLNHLVLESMRLTPAFAFSLPQCTSVDKLIGGFYVPAHTSVIIDAGRLNTDTETWGSDAESFRPDRFASMSLSKCRYSFMRFGVGGASGRCLGKHFADAIFKLTVVAVMEKYRLSVPEDEGKGDVWFTLLGDETSPPHTQELVVV